MKRIKKTAHKQCFHVFTPIFYTPWRQPMSLGNKKKAKVEDGVVLTTGDIKLEWNWGNEAKHEFFLMCWTNANWILTSLGAVFLCLSSLSFHPSLSSELPELFSVASMGDCAQGGVLTNL